MARLIKKAANIPGKRFIQAYWFELDKICHKEGCKSKEASDHFWEIDQVIADLAKYLAKVNTCLVVTADHGLVDIPEKNRVVLNRDFPQIYDCLSLPLCGDTRAPYCYVKNGRVSEFKKLVTESLPFCKLRKSTDFINKGVFGIGKPNPKLYDRVGDYILVCDETHLIRDYLMGEEPAKMEGFHGGVSEYEMFVPLIIIG
jgi:predicted AlkP superfamily pyrophosphatase or phosphodiesterase